MSNRVPGRPARWPLWVDPIAHGQECARFERFVVAGPDAGDCQLWVGAVGADGYGRNCAELHLVKHCASSR